MSIKEVNWRSFLSPDCNLHPDVTFRVVTENCEDSVKTFGAHKFLLAAVSPVFEGMFFGPMKETREVFEVKDTTPEAFNTMVSFFYSPPGNNFSLDDLQCPQKLFEVLKLSEYYQISKLKELTSGALSSLPMSNEVMIFAATVATKHLGTFEEESKNMLLKCLKFLYDTTSGGGDIFALICETKKNYPNASFDVLHELVNVGSEILQVSGGWKKLVFFDMEDREITKVATCNLTKLQKMALQWKIAVDFKPTASVGLNLYTPYTPLLIVTFGVGGDFELRLQYRKDSIALMLFDPSAGDPRLWKLRSTELPKFGEWTRIEISHEEEAGKFFFVFSVGGTQMGREESYVGYRNFWLGEGLKIDLGCSVRQPGFVRGLVVVEK